MSDRAINTYSSRGHNSTVSARGLTSFGAAAILGSTFLKAKLNLSQKSNVLLASASSSRSLSAATLKTLTGELIRTFRLSFARITILMYSWRNYLVFFALNGSPSSSLQKKASYLPLLSFPDIAI